MEIKEMSSKKQRVSQSNFTALSRLFLKIELINQKILAIMSRQTKVRLLSYDLTPVELP